MPPFTIDDVIQQTNQYRIERGLPALKQDPILQKAAEARAKDMAVTGNFSHDVATTTPLVNAWGFMKQAGYPYSYAGENLATKFNTATDTVNAWKASPTHNKNLIDGRYSEVGVAIVPGQYKGESTYFVVQFFGSKKAPQVKAVLPATPAVKKSLTTPQAQTQPRKLRPQQPRTLSFIQNFGMAQTTPQSLIRKRAL